VGQGQLVDLLELAGQVGAQGPVDGQASQVLQRGHLRPSGEGQPYGRVHLTFGVHEHVVALVGALSRVVFYERHNTGEHRHVVGEVGQGVEPEAARDVVQAHARGAPDGLHTEGKEEARVGRVPDQEGAFGGLVQRRHRVLPREALVVPAARLQSPHGGVEHSEFEIR